MILLRFCKIFRPTHQGLYMDFRYIHVLIFTLRSNGILIQRVNRQNYMVQLISCWIKFRYAHFINNKKITAMKTLRTPALVFGMLWLSIVGCMAQSKDIEAIKDVITKETMAFFSVDRAKWGEFWANVPYAYWSYSDSTSTSYIQGWDGLSKTFESYFKTSKPSKAEIKNEWQDIKVYGNGAYVSFTQKVLDEIEHDETHQVRVLEKKDGKWKIICVVAIAKYAKTTPESRVRQ